MTTVNALRLYGRLAAASLRARMQYKMDFLMSTFFYAMLTMSDFLCWRRSCSALREVGGWNIYEVGLLYGMSWISMWLYRTFAPELHNFDRYIVYGEFDGLLVRPWPTLLTLLGRNFEPHRLGAALQGGIILWHIGQPPDRERAPGRLRRDLRRRGVDRLAR